jgi:hypothetical protein
MLLLVGLLGAWDEPNSVPAAFLLASGACACTCICTCLYLHPHELHDKRQAPELEKRRQSKSSKKQEHTVDWIAWPGPALGREEAGKRQGYIGPRDSVALPQCGKALKGRAGRGEMQDGFSLRLDSTAPLTRSRSPRL